VSQAPPMSQAPRIQEGVINTGNVQEWCENNKHKDMWKGWKHGRVRGRMEVSTQPQVDRWWWCAACVMNDRLQGCADRVQDERAVQVIECSRTRRKT
jgi:hypothetical protein